MNWHLWYHRNHTIGIFISDVKLGSYQHFSFYDEIKKGNGFNSFQVRVPIKNEQQQIDLSHRAAYKLFKIGIQDD